MLEEVHRRATKPAPSVRELSHRERMAAVDWLTLEDRRKRRDMIRTFNFLSRCDIVEIVQFLETWRNRSPGGHKKLSERRVRKDVKKCFSSNRLVE